MKNQKIVSGMILLVGILLMINLISADYFRSSPQLTTPGTNSFNYLGNQGVGFPEFNEKMCNAGNDFVVQIAPFGCTPAVVRSDLLEEQNVPVFCQLYATKINPLIDVKAIDFISFTGDYPQEISGIGFHPRRAAISSSQTLLNSPILENIGYAVIVLKQQPDESKMPDFVSGNLTANIRYDIENAFGVGQASYYIPELTNEEWPQRFTQYGFWNSRAYLRSQIIDGERATISIYLDENNKYTSFTLNKGQTSGDISLPGFYCQAGLKLRLDDLKNPDTRARLNINGQVFENAEEEKFLENKCSVSDIQKEGLNENVEIFCSTDNGGERFNLKITPKLLFNITSSEGGNTETREVELGERLYSTADGKESVYLGYIGTNGNSQSLDDLFVYFVTMPVHKEKLTEQELSSISASARLLISRRITGSEFTDAFLNGLLKTAGVADNAVNYLRGKNFDKLEFKNQEAKKEAASGGTIDPKKVGGKTIRLVGFASPVDKEITNQELKENFESALNDYNTLLQSFPTEKDEDEIEFGKKALVKSISLASELEQKKTLKNLCRDYEQRFPLKKSEVANFCENDYKISSSETSSYGVLINGQTKIISFEGIYEPTIEEFSAEVIVTFPDKTQQTYTMQKNEIIHLDENRGEFMQLTDLTGETAQIRMNLVPSNKIEGVAKAIKTDTKTLKKDITENFGGDYLFTLKKINLEKVAKVSVLPNIQNTGSEANFSFNIGIEKRGIQLSKSEIEKRINALDESIENWESVSNKLGNVVKGFNAACLGVGTTLTIKNLFENFGGGAIARQQVMRAQGGWTEICKKAVDNGEYSSLDSCFIENSDEIDKDVEVVSGIIQSQEGITTENANQKLPQIQNLVKGTIKDPRNPDKTIDVSEGSDVYKALSPEGYNDRKISLTQARDIERLQTIINTPGTSLELENSARIQLFQIMSDVKANSENFATYSSIKSDLSALGIGIGVYGTKENTIRANYNGGKLTGDKIQLSGSSNVFSADKTYNTEVIGYKNAQYVVLLNNIGANNYAINETNGIYKYGGVSSDGKLILNPLDSNQITQQNVNEIRSNFQFIKYDRTAYQNKFIDPEVKYFETEPYKGLPAIVPFNLNEGWYVGAKQTLPGFGNIRAYDESGRATSFYICNVGQNGIQELNSNIGDDICRNFNPGVEQVNGEFPGLSQGDTNALVRDAITAIQDASQQYKPGLTGRIRILNELVPVGSPETGIPDIQCQDFMSPKECLLLFNSCDPVVCPASRCDLGGEFPVDNVIQSGIIGSTALCLPNAKEGIVVPVCLTGIKAGVDSLTTVQKNYRDCLQENLETGKTVGLCDEIHSVYLCDFFWSQTLPMSKILIPKALEYATGQTGRGGGEYASVRSAWDNAENSIDYMTNYYGANSFEAFKTGIIKEVGHSVCRNFLSVSYPDNSDLFNSLIEPESPAQYTAWFSEHPFTTATVPPTSQYKVFYHIFAGENEGAYYNVYLKNPEGSSFFNANPTITVDSGYINAGDFASETRDFTATSNYKQLCINVNGKEECGFNQVSTSFAIDYAQELYIQEQAGQTNIKTESECVSGTPSVHSFLQPNLQAGAEEFLNPQLYNEQIVRICSTDNPGQGTDIQAGTQNGRWIPVGTCDNGVGNLKCYLDQNSVKNVVKSTRIENETLKSVQENFIDKLLEEGQYIQNFPELLKEIKKLNPAEKTITINQELINKAFLNNQKAKLFLLRGDAFAELAMSKFKSLISSKVSGTGTSQTKTTTSSQNTINPPIPFSYELTGILGLGRLGIYFGYDKVWYWSTNKEDWTSVDEAQKIYESNQDSGRQTFIDEMRDLAKNLQNKGYESGLERLTIFTLAKENRALVTDHVTYTGSEFELDGGKGVDIFIRKTENWEIAYKDTSGEKIWINVKNIRENPHNSLITESRRNLFENLNTGKTLEQGAAILFSINTGTGSGNSQIQNTIEGIKSALEELNSIISEYGNIKYSDNVLRNFVDKLHNSNILNDREYEEINGVGLTNFEENAEYVKELLEIKSITWTIDSALAKLESSRETSDGKNYAQNPMFAAFVDRIYTQENPILTEKEYNYFKDATTTDDEKEFRALSDLLRKKKAEQN